VRKCRWPGGVWADWRFPALSCWPGPSPAQAGRPARPALTGRQARPALTGRQARPALALRQALAVQQVRPESQRMTGHNAPRRRCLRARRCLRSSKLSGASRRRSRVGLRSGANRLGTRVPTTLVRRPTPRADCPSRAERLPLVGNRISRNPPGDFSRRDRSIARRQHFIVSNSSVQ
jgi:hypothetical protein